MQARITLIGMEKELNRDNKSITDIWVLDNEHYDSDTLFSTIITTGGQFEVLYSDPDFFYDMCGYFWRKYKRTFEKWFNAFEIEYNPLENYDRHELTHEDTADSGKINRSLSNETETSDTRNITETNTERHTTTDSSEQSTTNNTSENKTIKGDVSGYDSANFSDKEKSTENGTSTDNGTLESESNGSHNIDYNNTHRDVDSLDSTFTGTDNSDTSNDRDFDRESHIHGNIGVTTSQQMLKSELEIQAWSIYQHIADIFCKELLITVY